RRAGAPVATPPRCAEPYAHELAGDWSAAAASWRRLGCPYDEARALAEVAEEGSLRRALAIADRLGAGPLAAEVRRRLRLRGVRAVPLGPRAATRADAAGLTARQR